MAYSTTTPIHTKISVMVSSGKLNKFGHANALYRKAPVLFIFFLGDVNLMPSSGMTDNLFDL